MIEAHDYEPFGVELNPPFGAASRKKYTGHERDESTGLDYMLARYYPSTIGRFLSVDPGVDVQNNIPQSWNLFQYVRNNVLIAIDPTGLARYVILVGDQGRGPHNVGPGFQRAADTRATELREAGHSVDVVRISTVSQMNTAISTGPKIDGGVVFFGHGAPGLLFIGDAPDPGTNLDSSNVGTLSGENLGENATVELNACNSAVGGEGSIANNIAKVLGVPTTGSDGPMSFSDNPNSRMNFAQPASSGPIYMVPDRGKMITFTPKPDVEVKATS